MNTASYSVLGLALRLRFWTLAADRVLLLVDSAFQVVLSNYHAASPLHLNALATIIINLKYFLKVSQEETAAFSIFTTYQLIYAENALTGYRSGLEGGISFDIFRQHRKHGLIQSPPGEWVFTWVNWQDLSISVGNKCKNVFSKLKGGFTKIR